MPALAGSQLEPSASLASQSMAKLRVHWETLLMDGWVIDRQTDRQNKY